MIKTALILIRLLFYVTPLHAEMTSETNKLIEKYKEIASEACNGLLLPCYSLLY